MNSEDWFVILYTGMVSIPIIMLILKIEGTWNPFIKWGGIIITIVLFLTLFGLVAPIIGYESEAYASQEINITVTEIEELSSYIYIYTTNGKKYRAEGELMSKFEIGCSYIITRDDRTSEYPKVRSIINR